MSRPERIRTDQSVALPRDFIVANHVTSLIEVAVHHRMSDQ
jgi:hypothetical protein